MIVVLDPLNMNLERNVLAEKHRRSLTLMHSEMCECSKMFFGERIDLEDNWKTEFVSMVGASCERYIKSYINY